MESAGDYLDGVVGGNAAIGNARNMAQLGGLQKTARSASAKQEQRQGPLIEQQKIPQNMPVRDQPYPKIIKRL